VLGHVQHYSHKIEQVRLGLFAIPAWDTRLLTGAAVLMNGKRVLFLNSRIVPEVMMPVLLMATS